MKHKGTAAFIALRASSVLLLPLVIWFMIGAVAHAGDSFEEMRAWIAAPWNAVLMALLIVIGAFHMRLGMNEVFDDYVDRGVRRIWKLLNFFVCLGAAALGAWSLYVLYSGA